MAASPPRPRLASAALEPYSGPSLKQFCTFARELFTSRPIATMATQHTPSEAVVQPPTGTEEQPTGILDRMKQAVGLSPRGHKIEFEDQESLETLQSPRSPVSPDLQQGQEVRETKSLHPAAVLEVPPPRTTQAAAGAEGWVEVPQNETKATPAVQGPPSPAAPKMQPYTVPGATETGTTQAVQQARAPATPAPKPSRVQAEMLNKRQEPEAGIEKPPAYKAAPIIQPTPEQERALPATPTSTPAATPVPATPAPYEGLADATIADMEAKGFHRGRISEGPDVVTADMLQLEHRPPAPTQGERVKVERMGGSALAVSEGPQEVYARPEHEAAGMTAAEVAEMKARTHAMEAEESQRRVAAKQEELMALRRQAQTLEQQSAELLEEAGRDRKRVDVAMRKKAQIEHAEWKGYIEAERAEQQRRAVVERAKPAARAAEATEREAVILKQQATESEFHAQVLENRARALIRESEEMADLSLDTAMEAEKVSAELGIMRQEIEDLKAQIDTQAARGLPQYINECEREIGALQHRIMQLREEISWAESEIRRSQEEADTWRRTIVAKESRAARVLVTITQLREDAEAARLRSRLAAEEARQPAELAEKKYEDAWATYKKAEEMAAEARAAQQQALTVVQEAVVPEQERQRALREAAEAELAAKTVETRAGMVQDAIVARVHQAEVKAETAVHLAEEAQEKEKELAMEQKVLDTTAQQAEALREQQEQHPRIEVPAI